MTRDEKQHQKMTQTPIPKLIIRLGVPTTVSMLISSLYNMADTYFVSRLHNTSATGAVGVVFPLMALIQAFGFFFGHGSGNYISRALGAGKREEAERMSATGFFCALGAGVLILYAAQLLPWMLVTRCTFLYHYFPSSVFCLAAIVLVLSQLRDARRAKRIGAALCVAALVVFVWFYPAVSGLPVPDWWAYSTKVLPSFGFY